MFLGVGAVVPALVSAIQPAANADLQADEQPTLKTIMDLMIPEGDGMPSATQAGGFGYLQALVQRDKSVAADLAQELAVVEALSERAFEKPFGQLGSDQQIAVLKKMENAAPKLFDGLRAYVYESYYTQAGVWKLIGYELYPTDHEGPHLKPFDDSLITDVRTRPKLYRGA